MNRIVETLRECVRHFDTTKNAPSTSTIICLQEIETFNPRSHFENQARKISRLLDMHCIHSDSMSFFGLLGFGNCIITNIAIHSTWNTFLPWSGGEPRKVIRAILDRRGSQICALNTHFGLKTTERLSSASKCAEIIELSAHKMPIIFCGDFNAELNSEEIRTLLDITGLKSVGYESQLKTYPSNAPRNRIDHIFLSEEFEIERVDVIQSLASDHLPLVTRISLGD